MFNVIHSYFVLICFRSLFSPRFIANETIFFYIFSDFSFFPFLSFSNFHSWFSFFLRNIISILILKKYNHSKWTVVCFSLASILIDWLISWLVSIWQMGRVGKLHFQFRSNFFVVDIIFLVWDVTVTLIIHTHQLIILKVIYQIRCDDQWKWLTSMYLFFPFFKVYVFWLIDWSVGSGFKTIRWVILSINVTTKGSIFKIAMFYVFLRVLVQGNWFNIAFGVWRVSSLDLCCYLDYTDFPAHYEFFFSTLSAHNYKQHKHKHSKKKKTNIELKPSQLKNSLFKWLSY